MANDSYLYWQCTEPDRARQAALCWYIHSFVHRYWGADCYRIVYGTARARRIVNSIDHDWRFGILLGSKLQYKETADPVELVSLAGIIVVDRYHFYYGMRPVSFVFDHTVRNGTAANELVTIAPSTLSAGTFENDPRAVTTASPIGVPEETDWGTETILDLERCNLAYWPSCEVGRRRYGFVELPLLLHTARHWFCPSLHFAYSPPDHPSSAPDDPLPDEHPERVLEEEADFGDGLIPGLDPRFESIWQSIFPTADE